MKNSILIIFFVAIVVHVNIKGSDERSELHYASKFNDIKKIKYLVATDEGKEVLNQFDIWGKTPLFLAVEYGNYEIVEILLHNGADSNMFPLKKPKYIPLWEALLYGKFDIAELLLEHGANYMLSDNFGYNIFHKAVECAHYKAIDFLLNKYDVSLIRCKTSFAKGHTALEIARIYKHDHLYNYLEEKLCSFE